MCDIVELAKKFAFEAHANQYRKYTNMPYTDHLAEVVEMVSMVNQFHPYPEVTLATAWLHDCMEDQGIQTFMLMGCFGDLVTEGVLLLSDLEQGNRLKRKQASRERLSKAPGWVQDIKVGDVISNIKRIAEYDPKFAEVYLGEKSLLLDVLTLANHELLATARTHVVEQYELLNRQ